MPGMDGTGPLGMGPNTNGSFRRNNMGRQYMRNRGAFCRRAFGGAGYGNRFFNPQSNIDETDRKTLLKNEQEFLERRLKCINDQLENG